MVCLAQHHIMCRCPAAICSLAHLFRGAKCCVWPAQLGCMFRLSCVHARLPLPAISCQVFSVRMLHTVPCYQTLHMTISWHRLHLYHVFEHTVADDVAGSWTNLVQKQPLTCYTKLPKLGQF